MAVVVPGGHPRQRATSNTGACAVPVWPVSRDVTGMASGIPSIHDEPKLSSKLYRRVYWRRGMQKILRGRGKLCLVMSILFPLLSRKKQFYGEQDVLIEGIRSVFLFFIFLFSQIFQRDLISYRRIEKGFRGITTFFKNEKGTMSRSCSV